MKTNKLMLFAFLAFCLVHRGILFAVPPDTLEIKTPMAEGDTIEYQLLIIDPAFESWFLTKGRPESFYSLVFLENWNRLLVNQWNARISRPGRPGCMPLNYLNYDFGISYGLTLNHKLFYYFRYMHERCRIFDQHPGIWRN